LLLLLLLLLCCLVALLLPRSLLVSVLPAWRGSKGSEEGGSIELAPNDAARSPMVPQESVVFRTKSKRRYPLGDKQLVWTELINDYEGLRATRNFPPGNLRMVFCSGLWEGGGHRPQLALMDGFAFPEYPVHCRLAAVATVLAVLLASPSARAGSIGIDFDLSNSVISILGGILTIPPDGSIASATATVTIQGSSLSNPTPGAAALSDLTLQASVDGTVGGVVTLTGDIAATQVGSAPGSLTAGLGNLMISSLSLNLSALINCTGGLCPAVGTFPISVMTITPISGVGNLGVGGFGTIGNATLNAILAITLSGNSAVINLVGQEISRTFTPSVPEPGTFGMLALGLLGLAGLGWRSRR